jgi:7-carboxy-7-deazaguanine synthase
MNTLRVKEIFDTIQGEGPYAGMPAIFIRLAGCNIWSGHEEDRVRDSAKGACALFCDTDFVGGEALSGEELYDRVMAIYAGTEGDRHIVITGGEPSLQFNRGNSAAVKFMDLLYREGPSLVTMESNGAKEVGISRVEVIFSPKPPFWPKWITPRKRHFVAVKVLEPFVTGENSLLEDLWDLDTRYDIYVQPVDYGPGREEESAASLRRAIAFVRATPDTRLCLQLHKIMGMP